MDAEKIREIWDRIVEEESEKDTAWHMVRTRASEEVAIAYEADLEDALAETRKALEEAVGAIELLLMNAPTTNIERIGYQGIIDAGKQALSVTPAGGVLFRHGGYVYLDWRNNRTKFVLQDVGQNRESIELTLDHIQVLDLPDGQPATLILKEVPCQGTGEDVD